MLRATGQAVAGQAETGQGAAGPPGAVPSRGGNGLRRVTRDDWLLAGFALLAAEGAGALTPARLAAATGAPQLRFFWQFRTSEAFEAALLTAWQALALRPLAASPGAEAARAQLEELAIGGASAPPGAEALEQAIRAWARQAPQARAALAKVDQHRLAGLSQLISRAGVSGARARERAAVLYAAGLGFDALRSSLGMAGAAPMQALSGAIFGGRSATGQAGRDHGQA
ncbi:hypothetical protein [Pseudogemmobacter faecipullorum]|uniref:TetR family transcriptional regulator n=1 Tax=Pseudogemmobacter faecipullorum TaxID=2755041 RepID=A0ABS8CKR7_9RHOB|nr:hypothetical protein [Pseudogemmobacter faecipullorum]MCB5409989.1 hypothetical protein [Pseudogemmobacter faecipullorum]